MYTDLLTKIKNAQKAKKATLKMAYSNMDMAVAEVLAKTGFIAAATKKGRMPKRIIEIDLKYTAEGQGAIENIKFISVPSRRLYAGYKDLRKVRQGYGIAVLSTPKGIMTGQEARKAKMGGQLLFEIW
jgi:small subunit ribosomal protein S8